MAIQLPQPCRMTPCSNWVHSMSVQDMAPRHSPPPQATMRLSLVFAIAITNTDSDKGLRKQDLAE